MSKGHRDEGRKNYLKPSTKVDINFNYDVIEQVAKNGSFKLRDISQQKGEKMKLVIYQPSDFGRMCLENAGDSYL